MSGASGLVGRPIIVGCPVSVGRPVNAGRPKLGDFGLRDELVDMKVGKKI